MFFAGAIVRYGVKYRKQSNRKLINKPKGPLQAIVIFPEIFSRFSLANAQTEALTNGMTKMSLLTLFVTSMNNYQSLKICQKIEAGIDSIRPRSPHCCISP